MLTAGDTGQAEILVQPSDTAKGLALSNEDSFPEVFATSRMIALMELAAARAMRPALQPGQLSVGVSLNVKHTAPTPVGGKVRRRISRKDRQGRQAEMEMGTFLISESLALWASWRELFFILQPDTVPQWSSILFLIAASGKRPRPAA